jgi:hypothetical protein
MAARSSLTLRARDRVFLSRTAPANDITAPAIPPAPESGTWMGFLASTMGAFDAGTLRAEVRADGLRADRSYWLVVQSYDAPKSIGRSRPVGAAVRRVSAEELSAGVSMDVVELRAEPSSGKRESTMVAWIDDKIPDLEFDGRRARPRPGSKMGTAKCVAGRVQISLGEKTAA